MGTVVLTLVAQVTRSMKEYQPLVIGAIAILVMLFMPGGLLDIPRVIRDWRSKGGGRATRPPPMSRPRPLPTIPSRRCEMAILEVKDFSRHFGGLQAVIRVT